MDNETYLFHQTPPQLASALINFVPLVNGDKVLEPFKGEGAFYDNFPNDVIKDWCEIKEGRDYVNYNGDIDWVITNPPFRLNGVNAFWPLIDYYSNKVNKGIAFLGNDYCFSTLTPIRLQELKNRGFNITKIVVCNVKKWRGRYFFFVLQKTPSNFYNYLLTNY